MRRVNEDEVLHRWDSLSLEQKQVVLTFDDGTLVDRIKSALQALFEKLLVMNTLGIRLQADADPFAASMLFTSAFRFTWQVGRSARNPELMLVDPTAMPVLAAQPSCLEEKGTLFEELRRALPDFLSERSHRAPMPKPRWKDLWLVEPSSVPSIEKQLAKLVEQALWAMASDPAYEVSSLLIDSLDADSVPFESWMAAGSTEISATKSKRTTKTRRKKGGPSPVGRPMSTDKHVVAVEAQSCLEEGASSSPELEEEEATGACETRLASDDESVGVGIVNDSALRGPWSSDPTAASTPTICDSSTKSWKSRWMPTPPQPSFPQNLPPRQLVCYIWNQTSQFASGEVQESRWRQPSTSVESPASPGSQAQLPSTPSARGSWNKHLPGSSQHIATPVLSVVVRNSFIDIDDPDEEKKPPASRSARSLSPYRFGGRDFHDHWHV